MTLTPLYYRLGEWKLSAGDNRRVTVGECRTNYRQLKRGQGLQRAVLLWEIIIGITTALAIRWGRGSAAMVKPRGSLVPRSEGSCREDREALWKQPKSVPWALCFRVELLCVRERSITSWNAPSSSFMYVPFVGHPPPPSHWLTDSSPTAEFREPPALNCDVRLLTPRICCGREGIWTWKRGWPSETEFVSKHFV